MASVGPLLHCDPKTAIKVSVRAGLSSSEDLCGKNLLLNSPTWIVAGFSSLRPVGLRVSVLC